MIRLAVRVSRESSELVLAELLELAPTGVEEVEGHDGAVEYAVYGAPGELPALPDLEALAGEALVEISTREVPEDWHERWRQFHRPVLVAPAALPVARGGVVPSLHVRPPWEPPRPSGRARPVRELVIDPGQAFGTGAHATTRLCLELLLALAAAERERGPVLDLGTGSGVLAIAAAMLGYRPVVACDHEQESVEAAAANAAVNDVALDVRRLDLRGDPLPWPETGRTPAEEAVPVVLANLLRPLLLDLCRVLPDAPGHLILGGLLDEEAEEVQGAFCARHPLVERARVQRNGWSALWLAP